MHYCGTVITDEKNLVNGWIFLRVIDNRKENSFHICITFISSQSAHLLLKESVFSKDWDAAFCWGENDCFSLENRGTTFSLENRETTFSLENRVTTFSLKNRETTFSLENRGTTFSLENRETTFSLKNRETTFSLGENACFSLEDGETAFSFTYFRWICSNQKIEIRQNTPLQKFSGRKAK